MAGLPKLMERAVSRMMHGEEVDKPVFQILGFKKIAGQGGSDRYRLNISDGAHSHTFAMLATQLNHMVPDGMLDNHCVVRAEKIVSNAVSEKRVLIILELTVLAAGSVVKGKIGNPLPYSEIQNAATQPAAAGGGNRPFRVQEPARIQSPVANPPPMMRRIDPYVAPGGGLGVATMPVRDVNPYSGGKVAIKARVTNKQPVRTWSNSRGEGKVFSMDLLDESGEIRMSMFNQQVDTFHDGLKVGNVYIIQNFHVKTANKQWSTLNNDYEISANNDTQIIPCTDADAADIPVVSYDFLEIANIESADKDQIIDVIGVCKRRGDVEKFVSRTTNKEFTKREIVLADKTLREISLTLWGKQAEDFEDDSNPVVAFKSVKVSDFGGRSLSCLSSSSMLVNPDIPEAHILRGWYDNEGANIDYQSLSSSRGPGGGSGATPWKLLREANSLNNPATMDKGDYYMSKVMVMAIKRDNAMYKACPEATCNKKVIDNGNGFYRCEKCNKETSDFKWRAMLNTNFADASDFVWGTCFQEAAEVVLGKPIEELGPIFSDDQDQFESFIKEATFKSYIVKFRCKMETYNNEQRLKHSVVELHPITYGEYAKKLLNEIKECSTA